MNDQKRTIGPAPEGDGLDRQLAALAAFGPTERFADQVMACVRRPAPAWTVALAGWPRKFLASPQRRWALYAGFSLTSAISTGMVAMLLAQNAAQIGAFLDSMVLGGLVVFRELAVSAVTSWAPQLYGTTGWLAQYADVMLGISLVWCMMSLICAWGLYRVLSRHPIRRVP